MRSSNELRVGIVVIMALVLMGFAYFWLRGINLGAQSYYLQLQGVANVSKGSEVRLQGVKIGQVAAIVLDAKTQKPRLTLAIERHDPSYKLYESYRYAVLSSSLLGENYVDISGPYKPGDNVYAPGAVIQGESNAGLIGAADQASALLSDARDTLKNLNTTITQINQGVLSSQNQVRLAQALEGVAKLTQAANQGFGRDGVRVSLGDPRAREALNATLQNTAIAGREAAVAARNLRGLTNQAGGVLSSADGVLNSADRLFRQTNGVLAQNSSQLNRLLGNFNDAARNTATLTSRLDQVLVESQLPENTQLTLNALRRTAENLEAGSAGFKAIAGDQTTQDELRATLSALRQTTESLRDTTQTIKTVITGEESQGELKGALATLNVTATTLQKTAENLQGATAGLNNVIGNQQTQDDLKASISELRGTLEASRGAAERINSFLGGRRNRNSPQEGGGSNAQQRGYAPGGFDFTYRYIGRNGIVEGRDARHFGDVTFNAELFGAPFRAGVANIGEGNDLTLQSGSFVGQNGAVRYGLYRSKLGLGAEYRWNKFSLEANLYDPNDRSYNGYLGYQVTPNLEILAGREGANGVRGNSIGVRLTP